MAEILFPDAANAFAKAQSIQTNALRDRLLMTQANREEAAYQRDSQARAIYPKAISGDAAATSQLAGLSPELHASLMKAKKEGREQQLAEFNQRTQLIGQAAGSILALPPDQRPAAYQAQRQRLLSSGLITAEQVPEQYNEALVTSAARNAQSVDALLKSLDEAPKAMTPGGMVPTSQMGRPAAPVSAAPSPPGSGTVVDRIVGVESGGDPNARNPRSSATGAGQFIASTWLNTIRAARPDLVAGKSPDEILALRNDPNISREMTAAYAQQNGNALRSAGLPVTPGTTYLAHFAGPQGAQAVLRSDPSMPVGQVLGATVVAANPFLRNMTAGDLIAWADRKMGGAQGGPAVAQNAMGGMGQSTRMAAMPNMPVGTAVAATMPDATPPQADLPAAGALPAEQQRFYPVIKNGLPVTQNMPPGYQLGIDANGNYGALPMPGAETTEAKAAAEERGKARGKIEAANPQAVARATEALRILDKTRNHSGLYWGTGATADSALIPATPMREFGSLVDQIKGTAFLQAFESLRGGGQITEVEGKKATDAIARLDRRVSPEAFKRALDDIEYVIKVGLARAQGQEPPPPPGNSAPGQPATKPPAVGTVDSGYRFKGGNPGDPAAWEPVK